MDSPRARSTRIAALFDRVADTYDAVGVPWFGPIADRLVQEIAPRPGEHALDVGCGRGAALFPLATAVGPAGRAIGIDLSTAMIEATRKDARSRGVANVELQVMDATAPGLDPGSFDLVTSSLVLFFLPDPAAALQSWHHLLRPGGRVGVSTFGAQDPRWLAIDKIFEPYLPPQMLDARTSGATGPFSTDEGTETLLTQAGFGAVRTVGFHVDAVFPDVDAWHRFSWSHGQRAMWEAVPEASRADVLSAASALLEDSRDLDGGIVLGQDIRLTLGEKT